ncbi:MAG: hypothetical protein ACR2FN_00980 [Chitinophagaceae bacterium]
MIKLKLLTVFILFTIIANAQQDFIILKKRNTTLQTFFSGSFINFQLKDKQWIEGYIKFIRHDSLILRPFQVQYLPTIWGTNVADTIWQGIMHISIKDIYAMPRKDHSLEYIKNGKLFQFAGAGYVLLNVINGLANRETILGKKNIVKLGAGVVVFMFGKALQWTHSYNLIIGKKYRLQYIQLNSQ